MTSRPGKKKSGNKKYHTHSLILTNFVSSVLITEDRLKTYIEIAPDPIIVFDNNTIVVEFNPAAEVFFGYQSETVIGRHLLELKGIPDNTLKRLQDEFILVISGNERSPLDFEFKKSDLPLINIELNYRLIQTDDQISGLLVTFRDVTERKQAELALRAGRDYLDKIHDSVGEAIFTVSLPDRTIKYVNSAVELIFGYTPEECINQNTLLFYPDKQSYINFGEILRERIQSGENFTRIKPTLKKKNGELFSAEVSSSIMTLDDGSIQVISIVRDLSDKNRADLAIRVNRERYKTFFQGSIEAIYVNKVDGTFEDFNDATLELFGYTKEELLNINVKFLYKYPAERIRFQKRIEINGSVTDFRVILKKKDGSEILCLLTSNIRLDEDNNIIGYQGIIRDITERINAQKKIEEQRKFFRQVLDITPNIIFAKDIKGRYILANQATADVLNTSVDNMIGKTDYQLFEGITNLDQALLDDQTVFETAKEKINHKNVIIDSDGNKRIFYTIKRPLLDEKGNVSHVIGVGMDITEQNRTADENIKLERKLERARRMESLGILAGGVAHDLNNILGPILGYPDLILEMLDDDSPIREDIKMIRASAERASDVVQDLLTLARRGKYEMKPLDLNKVITEYVDSSNFALLKSRYPDVKFDFILDEKIYLVNGSGAHFSKTIMNLIMNAFEAMHYGGTIILKTYNKTFSNTVHLLNEIPKGKYAVLEVQDTGYGISEEDLPHIFEPFYTRKEMGRSGSGLGLSVVFGVMGYHGGYIDIKTEIGVGTTFFLYVPHAKKGSKPKLSDDAGLRGTEKILVVDDGQQQRKLAKRLLSSLGYDVSTAKNGSLAVEHMKKKKIDLVILDMIMDDDFDGLDTYKEMIKIVPQQKAIIVSGYAETNRVKEAKKLGVGYYLRKPYSLKKIGSVIRSEIDNK